MRFTALFISYLSLESPLFKQTDGLIGQSLFVGHELVAKQLHGGSTHSLHYLSQCKGNAESPFLSLLRRVLLRGVDPARLLRRLGVLQNPLSSLWAERYARKPVHLLCLLHGVARDVLISHQHVAVPQPARSAQSHLGRHPDVVAVAFQPLHLLVVLGHLATLRPGLPRLVLGGEGHHAGCQDGPRVSYELDHSHVQVGILHQRLQGFQLAHSHRLDGVVLLGPAGFGCEGQVERAAATRLAVVPRTGSALFSIHRCEGRLK